MSKSIKLLSLVLALAFVFFTFVSCTGGEDPDTTTGEDNVGETPDGTTTGAVSDQTPGSEEVTNKYDIGPAVPSDVKFEGKTVTVATRKDYEWVKEEITVEYISGGVNDTIYTRQLNVEARLGITLVNELISGNNYAVVNAIRTDFQADDYRYDIIGNSCYSTIMYTNEGIFYNLLEIEHLDLTRPYWSQGFNEAAEIGDAQYMCLGAATLSMFKYLFVTFFNKDLVASYGDENFYEIVNNYQWTIDFHLNYCERFADTNNEALGETGTYGFVNAIGNTAFLDPYWSSCDMRILGKDNEGWFKFDLDTEKLVTLVDKLIRLHSTTNLGTYMITGGSDDTKQEGVSAMFAAGHAATCMNRLAAVESDALKNMEDEYGIIPVPMYDEAQKEYKSMIHDQVTALGVYSKVPAEQVPVIGAFLDVFAAESFKTVVPAYYDMALKNRYLQDDESAAMLDLIYESVFIDAGILYVKNLPLKDGYGPGSAIRPMIVDGKNSVATVYNAQIMFLMDNKLAAFQETIKKLQGK